MRERVGHLLYELLHGRLGRALRVFDVDRTIADAGLDFHRAILGAKRPGLEELDELREYLRKNRDRERTERHRFDRLRAGRRGAARLERDGFDAEVLDLCAQPARDGIDVFGERVLARIDKEREARGARIVGHRWLSYVETKAQVDKPGWVRADSSTPDTGIRLSQADPAH